MQKLGQERQTGRQLGASCIPTCSSAGRKREGTAEEDLAAGTWSLSLCSPHTPLAAGASVSTMFTFPLAFGRAHQPFMFSRQTPVVLFRWPSVLEVMRLTARCSLSCLLVKGTPQSSLHGRGPIPSPVSGKGIWSTNREPKRLYQAPL